jgi:hypothetical protein
MISGVDIEDWKDDEFLNATEEIPEKDKKITFTEVNNEIVLDLSRYMISYGKVLHERFKKFYNL